jgi:outer membrane protein OmpA-like peptidoglycan-associated protein
MAGLEVRLETENDLAKQAQAFLDGETPFLRATDGMVANVMEAAATANLQIRPLFQMTWSAGGDCLVTRGSIKTVSDLRGKTVALQRYGPHVAWFFKMLSDAGLSPSDVNIRWYRELSLPKYETRDIVDPVEAFRANTGIDAVFCISPDAAALTSGSVGTGSEGSVKGAKTLLSTKTADKVIADLYYVREDYYQANKEICLKFSNAWLRAQEDLEAMQKDSGREGEYKKLLAHAGQLLLDSPSATEDVKGLLLDCEFAGFNGSKKFMTAEGTLRNLALMTDEVQTSYIAAGLMSSRVSFVTPDWDWAALAAGLKNADTSAPANRYDSGKISAGLERKLEAESTEWGEEGTLFLFDIQFEANSDQFNAGKYATEFDKILKLSQTYSGSVVVFEGHANKYGKGSLSELERGGAAQAAIDRKIQSGRSLSLQRAQAVRVAYIEFCKNRKIEVDESMFSAMGMGYKFPKTGEPRSKEEWLTNFRLTVRVMQVEAEASDWK